MTVPPAASPASALGVASFDQLPDRVLIWTHLDLVVHLGDQTALQAHHEYLPKRLADARTDRDSGVEI